MRPIEFRVFYPTNGGMFPWAQFQQRGLLDALYDQNGAMVFMQYTGFKDNQRTAEHPEGQKIFEGDIISYTAHTAYGWQDHKSYEVIGEEFSYGHIDGETVWGVHFTDSYGLLDEEYGRDFEVIGNVHEHPQLLGDTL